MDIELYNDSNYPFYWLDELVEVSLNPVKADLDKLTASQLQAIRERLPVELWQITARMKNQAFSLYQNDQLSVVTGHYDQAVRLLQQQAQRNLQQYPRSGTLCHTGEMVLAGLNELGNSLRNRYPRYLPEPPDSGNDGTTQPATPDKVLCALSADQIGVVLKSAFDVRLLLGKSFRKVCQAVAPYLSTPWKSDISWDTVRSISGRAEQRDKEIAIDFLKKMIEKIRDSR